MVKVIVASGGLLILFGFVWDKLNTITAIYVNSDGANFLGVLSLAIKAIPVVLLLTLMWNGYTEATNASSGGQ